MISSSPVLKARMLLSAIWAFDITWIFMTSILNLIFSVSYDTASNLQWGLYQIWGKFSAYHKFYQCSYYTIYLSFPWHWTMFQNIKMPIVCAIEIQFHSWIWPESVIRICISLLLWIYHLNNLCWKISDSQLTYAKKYGEVKMEYPLKLCLPRSWQEFLCPVGSAIRLVCYWCFFKFYHANNFKK